MTWVIGASSIFGYGTMIADVRISFTDGTQADLVQKAYWVAPNIMAGFAGSVQIGFSMMASLAQELNIPNDAEPGAWEPEWVANEWRPIAAELFSRAAPQEQEGQCQIMMVGVAPSPHPRTLENPRAVRLPRVCIIQLQSPDFTPKITIDPLSVRHIGSGADVVDFTRAIETYFKLDSSMLVAEMGAIGMWPKMLASNVSRILRDKPTDGISPHTHILVTTSKERFMMTNDETHYRASTAIEFRMPKVARTYSEFISACSANALKSQGAIA